MSISSPQNHFERILYHRRFFLPAMICLFLTYPGSLACFLPSKSIELLPAQRIEMILLYLSTLFGYMILLIWPLQRQLKISLGFVALALPFTLIILLLRTSTFSINFHRALIQPMVILHFIPSLLFFTALCFMDEKKRDPSIFWSLIAMILPLGLYSATNKNAVTFLDRLRVEDISIRLAEGEGINEVLFEQCALVANPGLRRRCEDELNVTSHVQIACPGDGSECYADRIAPPTGSVPQGHPAPKPLSEPGTLPPHP